MRMLDNREYDIALEKSLLLPDVCGKAEGWLNKSGKPLNSIDDLKAACSVKEKRTQLFKEFGIE